jgi:alkaline phosphatase D
MRRTGLLGILLAATLLAGSTGAASGGTAAPAGPPPADPFTHGIAVRASSRSAQFWVRTLTEGIYTLKVSRQPDLDPATEYAVETEAADDNTDKPVVAPLVPNRRYYYAFFDGLVRSQIGTFKTMPREDRELGMDLALTGDSDVLWQEPPEPQDRDFEVLDRIREDKPDLFVYMGDTIYSDSETGAPLAATLEEKWDKYKNNRALPATKQVLRKVSTWAVWDDHEVINDFDGADLKESDPDLYRAGRRAFNDYWPVKKRYYRKVNWGSKIDLLFLDERTYRHGSADGEDSPCRDNEGDLDLAPQMPEEQRDELGLPPVDPECLAHVRDNDHTILGDKQRAWLKDKLKSSNARWKLIINEVPMAQLFVRPYDRWEGFEWERNNILNFIKNQDLKGVVFLTTDLHANVGTRIYEDITDQNSKPITYEMITGPIQTCTLDCEVDEILGFDGAGEYLHNFLVNNDLTDADCINIDHFGYGMVSTGDNARRLSLEWKSHNPAPSGDGGLPTPQCEDPVRLEPGSTKPVND